MAAVEQHANVLIKGTQYEKKFLLEEANETILKNLVTLRRMLWDMRAQLCQLEKDIAESKAIKDQADCLQAEIDSTAKSLDLQILRMRQD